MPDRRQFLGLAASAAAASALPGQSRPRNVVFILTDDHRYDAMGFMKGQPWLQTPNMDRLAREGAHFQNAFVTTALCSPSRATILTGLYAHQHKIVDNNTAIPAGTRFFPQQLQQSGIKTGFFGKWHMGSAGDDPQPGFDQWVSFRGQGTYLPTANGLNINGRRVPQKGYITDELTDYALEWLGSMPKEQPYFMYLSHKAVHANFEPPPRYKGKYANENFVYPETMAASGEFARHRPRWVSDQRNSWHGVEYPYHSTMNIGEYYKKYAETLLGVDDSVGRVLGALEKRGQLDSTLVIYMGDNGFAFGEHGLIDKRTAYEESMRVPLVARCPELFGGGTKVKEVVANLDIAPTVLDAAGLRPQWAMQGASWIPAAQGKKPAWRDSLLYEYYWERNYPQTPTIHAIREQKYKYVHVHGLWDLDELYDLEADPKEANNLIFEAELQPLVQRMNRRMFEIMQETGGMTIPLYPDAGERAVTKSATGSHAADFPPEWYVR